MGTNETPTQARSWTNSPLVNGTHYFYVLHAYDGAKLYSAGVSADTAPSAAVGGSPIYVDASAAGGNNGTSWADAYQSLKIALNVATNGVDIWVAAGM